MSLPVPRPPETLLFLSRSLERGGAERQLIMLATGLTRRGHTVSVAVFYGGGALESELAMAGVRCIHLNKHGRWDVLPFLFRLGRLLRAERPSLLLSYLSVPNILATLFKPLIPETRLIWGVRASRMDWSRYDKLSHLSWWLECRLSRFADLIIANSRAGQADAIASGFPADRINVVVNGIDTQRFRPEPVMRDQVRAEWGVLSHEILVGIAARLDPAKDHGTFLRAAAQIAQSRPDVRFVCIGDGARSCRSELMKLAESLGLSTRLIWAGARDDMTAVYSAMDIAASSSCSEGFSNVIAEAMACERPCVVTDVGDSAWIVVKPGQVVPASNPTALAEALLRLIDLPEDDRATLGRAARARVETEFSVEALLARTSAVLGLDRCA
jgi:glycosyltransferase involved in cell wall biosynthesis